MCPPLAHEHQETYATLRLLAESLAACGFCVLRFDYDGTGDSAGSEQDPNRVASWLGSVNESLALLRRGGVASVMVVGVRFGALLAALAARQDGDIDSLVLWDPVVSGRSYMAEQRLLGQHCFRTACSVEDGSVEAPGMVFDASTVSEIRALELRTRGSLARRLLVLRRPDRAVGPLQSRFADQPTEWGEAIDQADLLERGVAAGAIAFRTNETVLKWLSRVAPAQALPVNFAPTTCAAEVGLTAKGVPIVETPTFLGATGLFGLLTEIPGSAPSTTAVFLNVAHGNRCGPCRLWVELARRWAGAGVRCCRMDLSGLGDSPVRRDGQVRSTLRAPEHFDDIAEACSQLSPDDPSNVVLVGLCSSAYQVLESSLAIKPRGVVAVNAITSFRPPELGAGLRVDPRRQIVLPRISIVRTFYHSHRYGRPSHPGRLQQHPPLARPIRALTGPSRSAVRRLRRLCEIGLTKVIWCLQMLVVPGRRPSRWLGQLVANDVRVFIVCGKRDMRPVMFGVTKRAIGRLKATGRLNFLCLPDLEHINFLSCRRYALEDMATDFVLNKPRSVGREPVLAPCSRSVPPRQWQLDA